MFNRTICIALGLLVVFVAASDSTAAQFAGPDGTVSADGWTAQGAASTLHEATDETTANGDTDYILANADTTAEVTLSNVNTPASTDNHYIRFSFMSSGGGSKEKCEVQLFEGTSPTPIATTGARNADRTAYTTYTYLLATGEAGAITDYSDLRFKVIASSIGGGESVRVTWLELEVPDGSATSAPTLSAPTVANVTSTAATLGATIDDDGGDAITSRGTVWGTLPAPTGNLLAEGGTALGSFSHGRTVLPAGTQIYFRGYATNSIGTGYSPGGSFYTEPATQAFGTGFTNVATTSMRITWNAGSGDGQIVVVKQGAPVDSGPIDGTEHTAGTVFGAGAELGTQNYVVFRGSGTQVDVTGLTEGTTYHVAVYEYAGTGSGPSGINYRQSDPNRASQTTSSAGPTVPTLSAPTVANVTATAATLGATLDTIGGDTVTERGTVWGTSPAPTGNALAATGTELGTFSHTRTGLLPQTKIYYRGYAVNSFGPGYSPDDSFYTEPATQASSVSFPSVGSTTMRIAWPAGSGDGTIVVVKEGVPVDADPVDGTEYAASSTFQGGDELGTQNYVVFRGSGTQVDVTGLTAETTYHVAVYEYAGSGSGTSGINYLQTDPNRNSQTTATATEGHNATAGLGCDYCHSMHQGLVPRDTGQDTVCKTCHNDTDLAHMADVALHEVDGGATIVDCGACHEVHNGFDFNTTDTHAGGVTAPNVALIRPNTSKYIPVALEPALFQSDPNDFFAFDSTNPPWNGICQTCHTTTSNHTNDGTGNNDHEMANPDNCLSCHTHLGGFTDAGSCITCHSVAQDNEDGFPTRRAVVGEFGVASHHVKGGSVADADCVVCHYEGVDSGYHKDNKVDLRNPDDGTDTTLISFTQFTRSTGNKNLEAWVVDVQDNFCMKCHDSDGATGVGIPVAGSSAKRPFSADSGKDAPNVFGQFDPANSFWHPVRSAGSNPYCTSTTTNGDNITMESPWNQSPDEHNVISCFDCHMANGHGDSNQRMLRVDIDFDNIEAGVLNTTTMGYPIQAFCGNCHQLNVYFDQRNPEDYGSGFTEHAGAQGNHGLTNNVLSCMGCHGAPYNHGGLTDNGAAPGRIHGGSFTWTEGFAIGNDADYFVLGGYISGYYDTGTGGECGGGTCSHSGGKSYNR